MVKEFQNKKLLILGGVKEACDIVEHAKKMGAYVIVLDYYENSPAKKVADEGVLMDATNVNEIVAYCEKNKVDGVTTGFVDFLMPICYEVCKKLGLPYYATPKMIEMATNKVEFKTTCQEYNIPVPNTYLIGKSIPSEIFDKINYPVFVKPLDASGSRGAGVCFEKNELVKQFEEAISYSPSSNAIIEDYITGREFLLDYIAVDGEFRLLSMFDRYMSDDRGSAINFSNVSICPSKAIDNYLENVNEKIINMFKKVGFTDGLIFLQGYSDGEKITFYEMGCRLGGSFYNLEQACLGYNPVDMVIRYALSGKMLPNISMVSKESAKFDKYAIVCNYLLKGEDETIFAIKGLDKLSTIPSYLSNIIHRGVGTHYTGDNLVDRPALCVYLVADDLIKARRDINCLNEIIDVYNSEGKSLLMKKFNPDNI